jgi:hypothetical protein
MAVCKKCGCAIPVGSKSCDMCATVGSIAPSQQPGVWTPPANAAAGSEFASTAAAWAVDPNAPRPVSERELTKARKALRRAFWVFTIVGTLSVGLGAVAELANIAVLQSLFDWYAVAEGMVFLVLAYFTRRGSLVATAIGTGLYILDTVALLATGHFSIVRLVVIGALVEAILSANFLRQERRRAARQGPVQAAADQNRAA